MPLRNSTDPDADRNFGVTTYTADTEAEACGKAMEYASNNWQKPSGECICGADFNQTICYVYAVPKEYSGPVQRGVIQQ